MRKPNEIVNELKTVLDNMISSYETVEETLHHQIAKDCDANVRYYIEEVIPDLIKELTESL